MKHKIKEFIDTVYQSESLKKSAETFVEFEALIQKIFEERPSVKDYYVPPTENKKCIYDLLVKCHAEGHIDLLNHIITNTNVESLVYLYVHGLENERAPFPTKPFERLNFIGIAAHFDRLTSVVDALILRKIVLSDKHLLDVEHRSLLEKHIEKIHLNRLTSGPKEAQKILAKAFVEAFLAKGNTRQNHGGQIELSCASLLDAHWLDEAQALKRLNSALLLAALASPSSGNPSTDTIKKPSIADIKLRFKYSSRSLANICGEIKILFENHQACFLLLEKLELELSREYQAHGIDLSDYATSDRVIGNHLEWPVFSSKRDAERAKGASSILNSLLLALERKHHINEPENAPILFAKFIDPKEANKHVESGQLFEEFKSAGNPLHGGRSHRLQWHVVLRAIDEGILDLGTFTPLELVKYSTQYWGDVFDTYSITNSEYGTFHDFRSPHYVHSALLRSYDDFPALSGCLRKSFANTIREISENQPKENPLSHSQVIFISDLFGARFNGPGVEPDVLAHYKARNKNLLFIYPGQEASELDQSRGCIFYKERHAKN